MHPFKLEQDFLKAVLSNVEVYREDYQRLKEAVRGSEAWYNGRPVATLYQPRLVSPSQLEDFRSLIRMSNKIFEKAIRRYEEDPLYREAFAFPKILEELILLPSPLKWPIPMGRYDVFYRGIGDFTFCEINTDGSSAMNEDRALTETFLQTLGYGLIENLAPYRFELFDSWVQAVREQLEGRELQFVAMLDIGDFAQNHEFLRFREAFRKVGIGCELVQPEDLRFDGEWLYYEDKRIDAVYRRLVTSDLHKNLERMDVIIEAMRKGKTAWVGPVKTQVIHNKRIFAVLHMEEFSEMFTQEERDFIQNHIPYTAELTREKAEWLRDKKDRFLLKPADSYAAKGVTSGRDVSREEWEALLEEVVDTGYLFQEFARIPRYPCVDFEAQGDVAEYHHITGLFVYGGELAGVFSRASLSEMIADRFGGRTLPSFGVKNAP